MEHSCFFYFAVFFMRMEPLCSSGIKIKKQIRNLISLMSNKDVSADRQPREIHPFRFFIEVIKSVKSI